MVIQTEVEETVVESEEQQAAEATHELENDHAPDEVMPEVEDGRMDAEETLEEHSEPPQDLAAHTHHVVSKLLRLLHVCVRYTHVTGKELPAELDFFGKVRSCTLVAICLIFDI
jgi:hypothetical protein